ncbi:MAG: T9SS type A sorting domain-containing protein [Bacteroidota bacterium]
MKKLLLILFSTSLVSMSQAQIASWDFTTETAVATSTPEIYDANLDSPSALTRGTGAAASAGANSFRTVGFQNDGISTANMDYFENQLSAAAGYELSLSTIDARFGGTATYCVAPGVQIQYAYSLDGTTFTLIGTPTILIGSPSVMPQIDLTGITALQNIDAATTVTIRLYATGQTGTGGWGYLSAAAAGTIGLAYGGTVTSTSATCNLTNAGLTALTCNDNSTPIVTTDDYLTFSLNPTGAMLGTDYTVSVSAGTISPTTGTYGSATSFQLQDGAAGAGNVTVTITDNTTGACTIDQVITDPGACSFSTPIVFGTPSSLTGFNHNVGTPSTSQQITVSGNSLTADLVVTASTNFEVSLDNTAFSTSIAITPTLGSVASTIVYVRANSPAYGTLNGTAIVSSTTATDVTITLSGFANDYVYSLIDAVDNTAADGTASSMDMLVTLTGVIHCQDFDSNAGYNFTIIDGSGEGINVFSATDKDAYTNPLSGDSIQVKGKIAMYNGLLEVLVDSISLLSSGAALEIPTVVTALGEMTESQYVTLENMTFVTPIANFPTTNTNIDITDGTNTFTIRVLSSTDMNGAPAPQGPFNVTGLGGQFDSSNPYTSGYQLFPCGTGSFEPVCSGVNLPLNTVTWIGNGLEADAAGANISYQWFDCDLNQEISGQTNQQYLPAVNGNYSVIVNNTTCTDTSDCIDFIFWNVNELDLAKLVSLYPNPANDLVTISNKSNLDLAIEVIDLTGKVVYTTNSKNSSISIDLNTVQNGVYIVNVIAAAATLQERIIVQK